MAATTSTVNSRTVTDDRANFENAIHSLEAQITNVGAHLTIDSTVRLAYIREVSTMAEQLRSAASSGKISWSEAAQQAQETRNLVMEICRSRSTPVGRAYAEATKKSGYTLNQMITKSTERAYGKTAVFSRLSPVQKNKIYAAIIRSAGKPNAVVSARMAQLAYAGKGVLVIALGVSIYNVATSDNKLSATGKEIAINGAGIAGGIAGGALAGLACGPGAPACVTVGAFVGGALAAFGMNAIW